LVEDIAATIQEGVLLTRLREEVEEDGVKA
jgi:hypothetical protein